MVRVFDSTQTVWDQITQTRAILDTADMLDKPIWLITNASPTRDPLVQTATPLFDITPDQQADFIVQAAAISFALGVERIAIDRLADSPAPPHAPGFMGSAINWLVGGYDEPPAWGLIRADGSRRPAFDAYRTVIELFSPTTTVEWRSDAAADLVILEPGRPRYLRDVDARGAARLVRDHVRVRWAKRPRFTIHTARPERWSLARSNGPPPLPSPRPPPGSDANGFLTVAGSPRILVLDRSDFYRVVYLDTPHERARLR